MEVIQKYQCILGNSAAQKVIFLTAPRFLTFFFFMCRELRRQRERGFL